MKNWCKIIELENYSVLVQRLSDGENNEHIVISTRLEGVTPSITACFEEDSDKADEKFKAYNADSAKEFVNSMLIMMDIKKTE